MSFMRGKQDKPNLRPMADLTQLCKVGKEILAKRPTTRLEEEDTEREIKHHVARCKSCEAAFKGVKPIRKYGRNWG